MSVICRSAWMAASCAAVATLRAPVPTSDGRNTIGWATP